MKRRRLIMAVLSRGKRHTLTWDVHPSAALSQVCGIAPMRAIPRRKWQKEKGHLIRARKTFRSDYRHSHRVVYSHSECVTTAVKKKQNIINKDMSDAKLPSGAQGNGFCPSLSYQFELVVQKAALSRTAGLHVNKPEVVTLAGAPRARTWRQH